MTYKVRQLVKMLLSAGFTCGPNRGKGSHRRFYHIGVLPVTICHHDNDDAPAYLVKQVMQAIDAAKGAGD